MMASESSGGTQSNPFMPMITACLKRSQAKSVVLLTIVSAVMPVVEGILISKWTGTSGEASSAVLAALVAVGLIHVVLLVPLLIDEIRRKPDEVLAQAYELCENGKKLKTELTRRTATNRLVRDAFDRLNQQTCSIEYEAEASSWCLGGFHNGLLPILEPFLGQMDLAMGVVGNKTLEVYFEAKVVPVKGRQEIGRNGLCQHAWYGTHQDRCAGVRMDAVCSPAKLGFDLRTAYQQHIENNKQLFYNGDKPKPEIYFRQYATCPIYEACSDDVLGVLVLTSMQDEPFADDVLDTMAFLATIIANYLAAYNRCFYEHQSGRLPSTTPTLPPGE